MFSKLKSSVTNSLKHYWSVYKTDRLMNLYEAGKTQKILKQIPKFKDYNNIKIEGHPFLFFLISNKDTEMIQSLMKVEYKDKILNQVDETLGITPSAFGILNSEFEMVELLQRYGANIFMAGQNGNTALHIAAFHNKEEAINYCIQKGCDINAQNDDGDTPLHVAITKENKEIIELLLKNKASPIICNKLKYYPIHEAVETENLEIVKLLYPTLAEVRKQPNEFDPVHLAAKLPNGEILNFLLQQDKVYANMEDNEKRRASPLHYAVMGKSYENIKLLANAGAMMNAKDINGNTPMHLAVLNKDVNIVSTLHQCGASADIKNNDGYSAIDLCFSDLDQTMLRFFRTIPKYADEFRHQSY